MKPEIVKAIEDATVVVGSSVTTPRARFALLVSSLDDPRAQTLKIEAGLRPLLPVIRPLSPIDPHVLVVIFPDRIFVSENHLVFDASHRLREAFGLEEAEPDLPTHNDL